APDGCEDYRGAFAARADAADFLLPARSIRHAFGPARHAGRLAAAGQPGRGGVLSGHGFSGRGPERGDVHLFGVRTDADAELELGDRPRLGRASFRHWRTGVGRTDVWRVSAA